MLSILHTVLIEPFTGYRPSYVLGFLGWLMAILSVAGIVFVGFWVLTVIDKYTSLRTIGDGTLIAKKFIPEHTTTTMIYNAATKSSMPVTTTIPDEWRFTIELNAKTEGVSNYEDDISVSKSTYGRYAVGSLVNLEYSTGRIFDTIYIHHLVNRGLE